LALIYLLRYPLLLYLNFWKVKHLVFKIIKTTSQRTPCLVITYNYKLVRDKGVKAKRATIMPKATSAVAVASVTANLVAIALITKSFYTY
jgi:hypothetical protein